VVLWWFLEVLWWPDCFSAELWVQVVLYVDVVLWDGLLLLVGGMGWVVCAGLVFRLFWVAFVVALVLLFGVGWGVVALLFISWFLDVSGTGVTSMLWLLVGWV